jgi:serine protease Do
MPKVPVTFLGVETSSVPRVVSEQLGLAKGFGLVVDYVVPDGPAAAAGVQQNDIIKMLNDQILMEPDQLAKLIRSYPEGTNVTLTILRKNAETKLTVKLGKKEVRQHEHDFGMFNMNMDEFNEKMKDFNEKMKDFHVDVSNPNFGPDIRETVRNAQREAARARIEARAEVRRARDEARRESRKMRVYSRDQGAMRSTTIDLGKATIVFSDDKGELKLETVAGKKILTVKDPQGRLLFSGPVDSKEEVDKMPPDVRKRYEMLEQNQMPTVAPNTYVDNDENGDEDTDTNDNNNDNEDENDNDTEEDSTNVDVSGVTVQQISMPTCPRIPRHLNIVTI